MVWAPESAVMSRAVRPLAANLEMRVERSELGPGRSEFAVLWLAVVASRRPSRTFQNELFASITKKTPSRAARARMSAHETVALQAASTFDLMVSMTSKPRTEFRFGKAFFSPVKVAVSSKRIEPSQPCKNSAVQVNQNSQPLPISKRLREEEY
ncbi:hypothetical protein ACMD2_02060 [Ananas comosus]|uniref:Uncharacterized protein n=1 Tax=Ananas comosus TaxID=4615 RepID=A0A199W4I3_ANACO|nr:hypothetical protein ACMD2_02060 [Ananas comosus]